MSTNGNAQFINDFYDDFFFSKVNFENYLTEPLPNAGYNPEGFVDFEISILDRNTDNSSVIITPEISINLLTRSDGRGVSMRLGQTIEDLLNASWQEYENSFDDYLFDQSLEENGYISLFMQVRDSRGLESGIVSKTVQGDMVR